MEQLSKERIDEFQKYVVALIEKRPWITPSDVVSKSFYAGFTEFRFTEARAIAEQTKGDYLAHNKKLRS